MPGFFGVVSACPLDDWLVLSWLLLLCQWEFTVFHLPAASDFYLFIYFWLSNPSNVLQPFPAASLKVT